MINFIYSVLVLFFSIAYSQSFQESDPYFKEKNLESPKLILIDQINLDNLIAEDNQSNIGPYRFAFPINLNINFFDLAECTDVDNRKVCLLALKSKDAYNVRFIFNRFFLDETAQLFVFNPSLNNIFGAYTANNNSDENIFSTPLVNGDEIILEFSTSDIENDISELQIQYLVHDYKDFFSIVNNRDNCGVNVICEEANPYDDQSNAVAYLEMGWSICSGTMLNNTRNDLTPYFLTADHCYSGSPSTYRFYFNHQSSTCSGSSSNPGSSAYGSQLKVRSYGMDPDLALLKITGNINNSWDVFYAGWNRNESSSASTSVGIHHPGGRAKVLSTTTGTGYSTNWTGEGGPTDYGSHLKVYWEDGGTEGGSSGSALFDSNKRVIGQLTGGPDISCGTNGDYGLYGRLSSGWDLVSSYLDPDGTGQTYINGTYIQIISGCMDPDADNYNPDATINDGTCEYSSVGEALISFGDNSPGIVEIVLDHSTPIAGVQFQLVDSPDLISVIGASGGSFDAYEYTVSTSEQGTVLAFSLVGSLIPTGTNLLTNIYYEGSGNPELCINDAVISNTDGLALSVDYGNCIQLNNVLLGDINQDSEVNVLDIVRLVNIVLGNIIPNDIETYAADIDSDSIINILDIVQLVNIVLGNK